ncbi:MAG: hypothetical protein ACLP9Y_18985 [Mycobacterium sp.]
MASAKIMQLVPEPTAVANANTTAVAAELTTSTAAASAGALSGVAAEGGAVASMWAPVPLLSAAVDQQATHVAAAVASRGGKVARANDEALTDTVATDEQNRRDLTAYPVVSI